MNTPGRATRAAARTNDSDLAAGQGSVSVKTKQVTHATGMEIYRLTLKVPSRKIMLFSKVVIMIIKIFEMKVVYKSYL